MSEPIDRQPNQRPIDTALGESISFLGKLRLISERKVKLWHALLVAVFLAGFSAAMAWSISADLSVISRAAVKQTNPVAANVPGKAKAVAPSTSLVTIEKSANGKYSFVKLPKDEIATSGIAYGVNTEDAAITSPPNGTFLKPGKFLQIMGTAAGADFASYTLEWDSYLINEYNQPPYWDWKMISSSTTPVENSSLGRWLLPRASDIASQSFVLRLTVNRQSAQPNQVLSRLYLNPALHDGWPKQMDYLNTDNLYMLGNYVTADINHDGYKEIIGLCLEGVSNFRKLCAWSHDGRLIEGWPVTRNSLTDPSVPSVADINGDGEMEIVIGVRSGVAVYDRKGYLLWDYVLRPDYNCYTPVLASLDSDAKRSKKNIIIQCGGSNIYIMDSGRNLVNTIVKPIRDYDEWYNTPAVGDINNDGKNEIVSTSSGSSTTTGAVYVWDKDGTILPGWPQLLDDEFFSVHPPVLADIDGDNKLEVVILYSGVINAHIIDKVYVYNHLGERLPGWPQIGNYLYQDGELSVGKVQEDEPVIVNPSYVGPGANKKDGSIVPGWPLPLENLYEFFAGSGGTMFDYNNDGLGEVLFSASKFMGNSQFTGYRFSNRSIVFGRNGERLTNFFIGPEEVLGFVGNGFQAIVDDIDNDGKLELITTYSGPNFGWNSSGEGGDWYGKINVFDLDASADSATWPMFQANSQHTGVCRPPTVP